MNNTNNIKQIEANHAERKNQMTQDKTRIAVTLEYFSLPFQPPRARVRAQARLTPTRIIIEGPLGDIDQLGNGGSIHLGRNYAFERHNGARFPRSRGTGWRLAAGEVERIKGLGAIDPQS